MKAIVFLTLLNIASLHVGAWKVSTLATSGLNRRSLDQSLSKTSPTELFRVLDSNGDHRISLSELLAVEKIAWEDPDASDRARNTLGIPHPYEFIQEFDTNGDGELSFDEFSVALSEASSEPSTETIEKCAAIQSHLDTCTNIEILRCNSYIEMAQSVCHQEHPNVVQQCIMSSPCGSICSCIDNAERAAQGQASFVIQHPDGRQERIISLSQRVNSTEVGFNQPHRRLFWIFMYVIVVNALIITSAAAILSHNEIYKRTYNEVKSLNFQVWNSGPEPTCAAYVYWSSQCGAILSGSARGCSDGGTRVYENSCKDHFRYGSQGCGFLNAGCKSLCFKVNPSGCPCSIVDNWTQQDDVDYPGNDIQSLHVGQISDCRNACALNEHCRAFVVPPANGEENQTNCYLKGSLTSFKKSDGMTTWLKISTQSSCPTGLGGLDGEGLFERRAFDDSTAVENVRRADLYPRVDEHLKRFWPFGRNNDLTYLIIARFLAALYNQRWINREQLRMTTGGAVLRVIGAPELTPEPGEPVQRRANPRWRVNEGWRLSNAFRAIFSFAGDSNTPVQAFLNAQGTEGLSNTLFPPAVRSLLTTNEQVINAPNAPTWAGARSSEEPYPGINGAHAGSRGLTSTPNNNQLGYYQAGAMGPFSLEAAFILATQLAGINIAALRTRAAHAQISRSLFWVNAVVPDTPGSGIFSQCLGVYPPSSPWDTSLGVRAGYLQASGSANGDPRAGIYFIIDVDGQADVEANPRRNVFVFAMHTMDPHSRINVRNGNAVDNPTYTTMTPGVEADEPGRGPSGLAQQRFFAHAHSAWVRYDTLRNFMEQRADPIGFPGYNQIGSFHLYIQNEDTSEWPRNNYANEDTSEPPKDDK